VLLTMNAAATTPEFAPTAFDGFLLSSFGLGSEMDVLRLTALSFVFSEELLRLYAPFVFRCLNFVLMCLPLPNIFGPAVDEDLGLGLDGAIGETNIEAPFVPEEYSTFADDRKAKTGDENDIYMLQTHGFQKFRHNSRAFLKRNKLSSSEEDGAGVKPTRIKKSKPKKGAKGKPVRD